MKNQTPQDTQEYLNHRVPTLSFFSLLCLAKAKGNPQRTKDFLLLQNQENPLKKTKETSENKEIKNQRKEGRGQPEFFPGVKKG